jgi:Asp/Glu/hydantoin racemase
MDDPSLDAVKEISAKPAVGIAEAAMEIASMTARPAPGPLLSAE